jgi:hypothetical protein
MTNRKSSGYRPDQTYRRKRNPAEYRPDYRWLAEKAREAARTVSTQEERAELLARAKTWDLLAEHSAAASSEGRRGMK